MILSDKERETFTKVAKIFYETCFGKGFMSLVKEEREPFIQGQAWLYKFYRLAYQKGQQDALENIQLTVKNKMEKVFGNYNL